MNTYQQITGRQAETLALQYLESQGLKEIETNYHAPCGEIDLIMKDDDALIFIEVRFRQQEGFGSSIETITPSKQRRIIRTAQHYLQKNDLLDEVDCRFDVIGLTTNDKIIWIKDAFQVQY